MTSARQTPRRTVLAALLSSIALACIGAPAAAASGPPLDVPTATLAAALSCHGTPSQGPTPVLLVPGTTLTPDVNYDWNYEKAFTHAGRSWCAVTIPNHGMSDIQVSAEYIVYAIRTMHHKAGRRISVVGYSQGGMSPRWALKWWPDTRAMVDDFASLDPSNHGTLDAVPLCGLTCAPSIWQQRPGANFLTALNAGAETYAGISYTQIYSLTDEVVFPNFGPAASSSLHTGAGTIANIPVQTVCPTEIAEHISMGTTDPVGYALVMDALGHAGPAKASRIPTSVCAEGLMPAVNPVTAPANEARVAEEAGTELALYPRVASEPPLAPYAH